MNKRFIKFVLPSMLAFAFSGVYSIVDGLFIGQSIGDAGLSAINFAYPLVVLIQASGTGIGLGGAVCVSIAIGQGEKSYLGTTLFLLAVICIAMTGLLIPLSRPILTLFGAGADVLEYATEYMVFIAAGAAFQILANGLAPLLRNFGKATAVMLTMIAGFLTNIGLDWLFIPVLGYGMKGAAAATILGQCVTMLPCIALLIREIKGTSAVELKPEKRKISPIIQVGVSPFGLAAAPYVILIMMNKFCMIYGGTIAVAAYSVVSYLVSFVQLLLQGIGDGCQPLISLYAGQDEVGNVYKTRNLAYKFALAVAGICSITIYLLRGQLPMLFGVSDQAKELTTSILPIFCFTFLLYAITRVTTSYFYSTKKNRYAYCIIYAEPVIVLLLLAVFMPPLLGLNGVWLSIPMAQLSMTALGLLFIWRQRERQQSG